MKPYIDIDNIKAKLGKKLCTDMALRFCEIIEKGGYRCGIYANPSWLKCYYDKARIVGKYDIWLAHWTNSPDIPSRYDYGQASCQVKCNKKYHLEKLSPSKNEGES